MCQPVCSNRTLDNGMETYNATGHLFPGTGATSVCEDGFELVGDAMAVCTPNATWDRPLPLCRREFTCVDVEMCIEACDIEFLHMKQPFEQRLRLIINRSSTVNISGPMSMCDNITLINGMVSLSNESRTDGVTATFGCDAGFVLDGTAMSVCNSSASNVTNPGGWVPVLPMCRGESRLS